MLLEIIGALLELFGELILEAICRGFIHFIKQINELFS